MSTIDSEHIIRTMLRSKGTFPGDPPVFAIYRYQNQFDGGTAYKLIYNLAGEQYFISEGVYVNELVCLFRDGTLTDAGQTMLDRN